MGVLIWKRRIACPARVAGSRADGDQVERSNASVGTVPPPFSKLVQVSDARRSKRKKRPWLHRQKLTRHRIIVHVMSGWKPANRLTQQREEAEGEGEGELPPGLAVN